MSQQETRVRKGAQNLRYTLSVIAALLESGQADDESLDLVWTMVRNYCKSRRLLCRLNILQPEVLKDAPKGIVGYLLNDEQTEVLRDAQIQLNLCYWVLNKQYYEISKKRLDRDLAALNDWWRSLNKDERHVSFAAIGKITQSKRPAKVLSDATGVRRLMLLVRALEAVDTMHRQAREQEQRWKALDKVSQRQIMKSIETHAGMPAKQWWNQTPMYERTPTLKKMIDVLESMEHGEQTGKKSARA